MNILHTFVFLTFLFLSELKKSHLVMKRIKKIIKIYGLISGGVSNRDEKSGSDLMGL